MSLSIYQYEHLLLNDDPAILNVAYDSKEQAERESKKILKFAVEELLHWTPEEMSQKFNKEVVKRMKLENILINIPFPMELDAEEDLYYYAYCLYPEKIAYNIKQSIIYVYRRVMSDYLSEQSEAGAHIAKKINDIKTDSVKNKLLSDKGYQELVDKGLFLYKFPKEYLLDNQGTLRACVCLQYAIANFMEYQSIEDLYILFSQKKISKFLEDCKLLTACSDLFESPLSFLHESLPECQKNDLLYYFLIFSKKSVF